MVEQFKLVPFTLAASSEMLFRSLPILDRVKRLKELGFLVEIWDWTKHDIKALAATGASFSSMTGYVTGTLADDAGADELLRTARQSVPVAKELGIPGSTFTARASTTRACRCSPARSSPVPCGSRPAIL